MKPTLKSRFITLDLPELPTAVTLSVQLAKLEVLIEAQSEDYSDEPPLRKAPPRAPPAVQPPPPPVQPVQPAQPVPPPGAPPAGEQRSPAPREQVNSVHQPEPAPERATVPVAAVAPVPVAPAVHARVAPWLDFAARIGGACFGRPVQSDRGAGQAHSAIPEQIAPCGKYIRN